ncbi:hypothetical protein CANCADRAFT_18046, partial [Tortispora caseinolytica NRRL Y-17796]
HEIHGLEEAFEALDAFLDDNMVHATEVLKRDNGVVYYQLARTVIVFLQAILGFQHEDIRKASEVASMAEKTANRQYSLAHKGKLATSVHFDPGTEYNLAFCEAHLMNAVLLLLSESVLGSMKALYKLQHSFRILHDMYQSNPRIQVDYVPTEDDEPGNLIDEYTISGVRVCFGILHIILSSIPPNVSRVLQLIGLHGDRQTGLDLLWKASESPNIHGTMAVFALLQYFCGPAQVCDIDSKIMKDPLAHCEEILEQTKKRFNNGALWDLQTARLHSVHGRIQEAIDILQQPRTVQLTQIEYLLIFEKSLDCLYLHKYELSANSFLSLIKINSWSHALYAYAAAICMIELYREACAVLTRSDDPEAVAEAKTNAAKYKKLAMSHLEKTDNLIHQKKSFMQRGIPFEGYISRKLTKWKQRAQLMSKERGGMIIDLVDAVGVSPVNEIVYVWNGYKRMSKSDLDRTLSNLNREIEVVNSQEGIYQYPRYSTEEIDETLVLNVLRAAVLRNLGNLDECKKLLDEALILEKIQYKDKLRDEWAYPATLYEMGIYKWIEGGKTRESAVAAKKYIDKAAEYKHDYHLSSRVGLRIQTALESLK